MRQKILLPVLLALAAAVPSRAAAQGPFVGAGVGVGRIEEPDVHERRVTPSLHLRGGWAFTESLALVVEGQLDGMAGTEVDLNTLPDLAVFAPGSPPGFAHDLRTLSILASLQAGSPRTLYVRPGIGFARHTFAFYQPNPADGWDLKTEGEWGPAAGLAVGREVTVVPGFPLGIEAVARWSAGEDSSSPRWSAGVQIVRDIRF